MPTAALAEATPTTEPDTSEEPVARARRLAEHNLRQNLGVLATTQPDLSVPPLTAEGEWLFARDGSVSLLTSQGWWTGCSLPLRVAKQQLKSMEVAGPVACFLNPLHGAHLRVALDTLKPTQAVIAIVLDAGELPLILASTDFASDLQAHRLWLVAGDDWSRQLAQLLADRPGLATPQQFVRLSLPDVTRLDPVIAEAQSIFGDANQRRATAIDRLKTSWTPDHPGVQKLAVLGASRYRLLDDAAIALATAAGRPDLADRCVVIDADRPSSASTLALVEAATTCGGLVTADLARGDLPDVLPSRLPWITWMTVPRVPAAAAAGANDRLLVADPQWVTTAVAAGWRRDAVVEASWPLLAPIADDSPSDLPSRSTAEVVAVVADTLTLEPPAKLEEFSSHLLLWQAIRSDLANDPLAAGDDAEAYLHRIARRQGTDVATLDRRLFVAQLIWPAVAQGLAMLLLRAGCPLRLIGNGWDTSPDLAAVAAGDVRSREDLGRQLADVAAVVDVRPTVWRNGLYALPSLKDRQPLPVIRTAGRTAIAIRQDVSTALAGKLPRPAIPPSLDLSRVLTMLRREA